VTEIVARLQTRYQETQGFRADFLQEVESATFGYTLTSQGRVCFKKPGKMRWDFSQPAQLLVSDGAFFWFYQAAEKQVVKTPFHQAFRSHTPISFLTGVGRLEEDFEISLQDTAAETYVLSLSSKHDADAVGRLTLAVDAATFDIVRATVSDPLGNITRLQFTNITRNIPLPDSLFQLTIPAGVDIVEPLPVS
jgi:outer membrane lipoprotein carrier protein